MWCAVLCLVAQSCLTLCNPTDCNPPGSSVHGGSPGRLLEWIAMTFPRAICIPEVIDTSPGNLDFSCTSSSPAFHMMYSAYMLNKQGDNIQPWCTPFPIWNQSVVPCPVLTVAFWPEYRFLRRQVKCSGIPISLRIFHSLLWSTQSKALA